MVSRSLNRRHRALALGIALAAVAAACSSEATSTPGPTLTTMVTTTTTAPTTTTTTIAATTTTEATTTTTAATTTTLPAGPANAVVPLFVGGADSSGWLSLGAWQQTRWQRSSDPSGTPITPGVSSGTEFTVTNLAGETTATVGANVEACFDGRVGPTVDADVTAPDPPGFGYNAVAVLDQPWELKPRQVATVDENVPAAYQALGEAAFAAEPVDPALGSIEQLVVADLDGDGEDEALMVFEYVQPSLIGAPGDLAALLLVDVGSRTAETVVLSTIDMAPADPASTDIRAIDRFRVLDVADLNGDGRMEVIVHSWYYEGAAVGVFEYDGATITEVLSTGCGA
jgi:hypothetical protein